MKWMEALALLLITLLLIVDYFPSVFQSFEVPTWFSISLFAVLLMNAVTMQRHPRFQHKEPLKWQIFFVIYLLFLMGLFTLMGGQSTAGIAFNNFFFWIVFGASLLEIYSHWKKRKRSQSVAE